VLVLDSSLQNLFSFLSFLSTALSSSILVAHWSAQLPFDLRTLIILSTMLSPLEQLPSELFDFIFDKIHTGDSIRNDVSPVTVRAFYSLALASKTMLHVARPHLYKIVSLNSTTIHRFSAFKLARTLCIAPHLALLIREINVRWCVHHTVSHALGTYLRGLLHRNHHDHPAFEFWHIRKPYYSAGAILFRHVLDSIEWHPQV
jgi:hypothetical protein